MATTRTTSPASPAPAVSTAVPAPAVTVPRFVSTLPRPSRLNAAPAIPAPVQRERNSGEQALISTDHDRGYQGPQMPAVVAPARTVAPRSLTVPSAGIHGFGETFHHVPMTEFPAPQIDERLPAPAPAFSSAPVSNRMGHWRH